VERKEPIKGWLIGKMTKASANKEIFWEEKFKFSWSLYGDGVLC
jgi:hypothetical protein